MGDPTDVVFSFAWDTRLDAELRGWIFTPDQIVLHLMRSPHVGSLLVADGWRSAPVHAVRWLHGRRAPALGAPQTRTVAPLRLRRRDPRSSPALLRSSRRYLAQLARAAARAGQRAPVLLATHPAVAAAAAEGSGPWSRIVYYGWDDWCAHPAFAPWHAALGDCYDRIGRSGIHVVGVTEAIVQRIAPVGPGTVIPNGVDAGEWRVDRQAPDWFSALERPRGLYCGTIDSRIDLDAVQQLGCSLTRGSLTFVGSQPDAAVADALGRIPRVSVRGVQDRRTIVGLVQSADVGLVPHRRTPLTEAMSPLKLYEYVAAGRPVAATRLPPMEGVHDSVFLADDGAGFPRTFQDAVRRGNADDTERLRFLDANAWETRMRSFESFVLEER